MRPRAHSTSPAASGRRRPRPTSSRSETARDAGRRRRTRSARGGRGRFLIPEITVEDLATARQVMRRYAGLDFDLADAVNAALAAEYRTDALLTLDRRDFRGIRPLTAHQAFRILPDDA